MKAENHGSTCGKCDSAATQTSVRHILRKYLLSLSLFIIKHKLILCCIQANHVSCCGCLVGTIRRSTIAFLPLPTFDQMCFFPVWGGFVRSCDIREKV